MHTEIIQSYFNRYFNGPEMGISFRGEFLNKFLLFKDGTPEQMMKRYYNNEFFTSFDYQNNEWKSWIEPVKFDSEDIKCMAQNEDLKQTIQFDTHNNSWFYRTNTLIAIYFLSQSIDTVEQYFQLQSDDRKKIIFEDTIEFFNNDDIKKRIDAKWEPLPFILDMDKYVRLKKLELILPEINHSSPKTKL